MTPLPFGRYTLLKRFGIGGTSELWVAIPRQRRPEEKPLLIKRLLPHLTREPAAVELFLQEAKLGANLQHPNIVRTFESGEVEGIHYIARQFVHGHDLLGVQSLARHKPSVLTHERALHIIASVCEALAYAYHRVDSWDCPPRQFHGALAARHILISTDGAVKVIGFGGKLPDAEKLLYGNPGTGRFDGLTPEHVMGEALDHRTDIFTAGLVLYELLTGVHPLQRYSARDTARDTARATLECQIPSPSQVAPVPSALDAVVMKALAKAPGDRYQDPRDFQLAIEGELAARWAVPGPESLGAMMYRLTSS